MDSARRIDRTLNDLKGHSTFKKAAGPQQSPSGEGVA